MAAENITWSYTFDFTGGDQHGWVAGNSTSFDHGFKQSGSGPSGDNMVAISPMMPTGVIKKCILGFNPALSGDAPECGLLDPADTGPCIGGVCGGPGTTILLDLSANATHYDQVYAWFDPKVGGYQITTSTCWQKKAGS